MKYLISPSGYRVYAPVCDDGSGQADSHGCKAVEDGAKDGSLRWFVRAVVWAGRVEEEKNDGGHHERADQRWHWTTLRSAREYSRKQDYALKPLYSPAHPCKDTNV
jgi:hypothetical protein